MTESTEILTREEAVAAARTLFAGSTPDELIAAASSAATALNDVIRQRKLFKRIRDREHILVEGWQALGSLVGVFAAHGSVDQLPWPDMIELPPEPPQPGREPRRASPEYPAWEQADTIRRAWEQHRDLWGARNRGLAYGFRASFRAIKDGADVGWAEGRCTRAEDHWRTRDDYALSSMAQTRGQSRTLRQPLGFIVSLAGYATTPAEEYGDDVVGDVVVEAPAVEPLSKAAIAEVAATLQRQWPGLDAHQFMAALARRFDGEVPEIAGVALRAWAWWATQPAASGAAAPQGAADAPSDGP